MATTCFCCNTDSCFLSFITVFVFNFSRRRASLKYKYSTEPRTKCKRNVASSKHVSGVRAE